MGCGGKRAVCICYKAAARSLEQSQAVVRKRGPENAATVRRHAARQACGGADHTVNYSDDRVFASRQQQRGQET